MKRRKIDKKISKQKDAPEKQSFIIFLCSICLVQSNRPYIVLPLGKTRCQMVSLNKTSILAKILQCQETHQIALPLFNRNLKWRYSEEAERKLMQSRYNFLVILAALLQYFRIFPLLPSQWILKLRAAILKRADDANEKLC